MSKFSENKLFFGLTITSKVDAQAFDWEKIPSLDAGYVMNNACNGKAQSSAASYKSLKERMYVLLLL